MTNEEEIVRANEVKHLLANQYLREALDSIEAAMVEAMVQLPLEKDALLKECIYILRCKRKFVELMTSHIETGKLAKIQQEHEERKSMLEKLIKGTERLWK